MQYTVLWLGCLLLSFAHAQTPDTSTQELLRQTERERVLREQLETRPDARLPDFVQALPDRLPQNETPCFPIARIEVQHRRTGGLGFQTNPLTTGFQISWSY